MIGFLWGLASVRWRATGLRGLSLLRAVETIVSAFCGGAASRRVEVW